MLPIFISDDADLTAIETTLKRVIDAAMPNDPDIVFVYQTRRVEKRHVRWHDERRGYDTAQELTGR